MELEIKKEVNNLHILKGGFGKLAEILVNNIKAQGGEVLFNQNVTCLKTKGNLI